MAKLSKYYKVTRQIMVEYVSDLYLLGDLVDTKAVNYTVYTGNDDNVYYTETPSSPVNDMYTDALYFIKFPDKSLSEYTYLGLTSDGENYSNTEIIKKEFLKALSDKALSDYVKNSKTYSGKNMYYDKIRIHLIYGFLLDGLSGFCLLLKTKAKYLGPVQLHHPKSVTTMLYDDNGNPLFETELVTYNDGSKVKTENLERLVFDTKDIVLLDYYFPKECLNFNNLVKYHKVPIYLNECFYDRYIEIKVPSAYYLSIDAMSNDVKLSVPNIYGYAGDIIEVNGNYYARPATDQSKRMVTYNILPDPLLIINFSTVSEENTWELFSSEFEKRTYPRKFYQDPINQIAINYKSNSDFFNIRIFEDTENNEVIYYPVFGEGNDARELDWGLFNEIETGAIPMITEGFYDGLDNVDKFNLTYGENSYKWIIYNDMNVTYVYSTLNPLDLGVDNPITNTLSLHFTNIIDYGQYNPETDGKFWRSVFIPRVPPRNNMYPTSILISYTCRLVNRLTGVEAIRNATLRLSDPTKYVARRITLGNVTTYKIVNQINRLKLTQTTILKGGNDKMINVYYDATNLVVRDMGTNNIYTLGQMTLHLKHTSSNYLFRLFTLNEDNVRIPYDLTGPYRYKLVFPSSKGEKIVIRPYTESTDLNFGIGLLVFHISEDYVKMIMNVSASERYFAIMTDTDKSELYESTLYEGKVAYY